MELKNKRILVAAQYAPPYGGNFIPSLKILTEKLEWLGAEVSFAFPKSAAHHEWAHNLETKNKIIFTGNAQSLVTPSDLENMPSFDLVYTHFEGYDTAFINHMPLSTKFVWHMHDTLSFQSNILKKAYQLFAFWRHYGKPFFGHNISLIAVNGHESDFVRPFRASKKIYEAIIPNGVDISRIKPHVRKATNPFIFLAYGGRNSQKRVDVIFKAGQMLTNIIGGDFSVLITTGIDTEDVAHQYFGDRIPGWLRLVEQQKDINILLNQADCFISSSDHETFSYAIAEAVVAGIPVISSDIPGTKWNEGSPATKLFPKGDAAKLCMQMENMINTDFDELYTKTQSARQKAIENLSLDAWSQKIIDFFKTIS